MWGRSLGRNDDSRLETLNTRLDNQALLNFILDQRRNGRTEGTIITRVKTLKQIATTADLNDPEAVKDYIATKQTWNVNTRLKAIDAYSRYLEFLGKKWKPPTYMKTNKLPFIPTEEEIDSLINASGHMLQAVLQCLKETGIRIGELTMIKPTDLDIARHTLNITPEKGSNGRILPITDKLIAMIRAIPRHPKAKYDTLFQSHKDALRDYLDYKRKQVADRLGNPRIRQITFHTLRHWKGTMEYHNYPDIMHVKHVLGHKSVTSTLIYINLESALFLQTNENFICKVAHNEKEETDLIEAGFQHVNNRSELAFYKKRK